MKWGFSEFISEQFTKLPPPIQADLTGKSVLVVGANTGIGFELVKQFAYQRPRTLILGCRNEQKGLAAVAKIEEDTKFKPELKLVDLNSFKSVIDFSQSLSNVPLDIVVLNAGIMADKFEQTHDGWETTLQINHLSTALLAILLIPNLELSAQSRSTHPRLVITASGTHYWAQFGEKFAGRSILETLNDKEYCTPEVIQNQRYQETKLLNVLFTRALSEYLPRTSLIIPTSVCPGFCYSELRRSLSFNEQVYYWLLEKLTARTSEQGARQLLWAALGPDGKEGEHVKHLKGAFVMTSAVKEPSDFVISKEGKETQDRIWLETMEILGNVAPKIRNVLSQYFVEETENQRPSIFDTRGSHAA